MEYSVFELNSDRSFTISVKMWQKNQTQYDLLLRYLAVPLQENENTLWLAIESIQNITACETFSFLFGKRVEPVEIGQLALKQLLQTLNPIETSSTEQLNENTLYTNVAEQSLTYHSAINDSDPNDPIIRLFNQLLEEGMQQVASDIHIEPCQQHYQIRYRVDGVLHLQQTLSTLQAERLISRLKLLAKLDISEVRLPQDGRFSFKTTFAETLDLRLSSLPTQFGEKIVLRLQHNKPFNADFAQLGMASQQIQLFQTALLQPQGLILVTGPTGSGKSLTLYSGLHFLNEESRHLITAEDPIEMQLAGVIQTQINPAIGLTFAALLKTFLRQDPDVIMLGEIRDKETAEMAIRAAQTGHLVLSTLHTNDAHSAISRLTQLGLSRSEIESSLLLVIAQRLLRKICTHCLGDISINCHCCNGYQGRIGVFQFLTRQNDLDFTIDYPQLSQAAQPLIEQNITNEQEVLRVLGKPYNHRLTKIEVH